MSTLTGDENPSMSVMLTLMDRLMKDVACSDRDIRSIRKRTKSEGLSFLTKTLPLLGKACDRALGTASFKLPSNFKKRWRGSEIPALCGSLFSAVFERDGHLRKDACPTAIKNIRMICFLFYKWTSPFAEEVRDRVLQEFVDKDNDLPSLRTNVSLYFSRRYTASVFSHFKKDEIIPSHGPGIVSNSKLTEKREFFPPWTKVVEHFGQSWFNHESEIHAMNLIIFLYALFEIENEPYKPTAKVILVPKDSRGPRIISCEPVEHQYIQQGLRKWTQHLLESHPLSRGHVNFEDQGINRNLVLKSSIDKSYSTLDLKDASDRVTLEMVQYIFGSSSAYLEALLACRSEYTLIEKTEVCFHHKLRKFAPMGSAVCFTTLAWIVYILSYSYLRHVLHLSHEESKDSIYVYGDDIVVKTEYAELVAANLVDCGLLVNHDKSFINSNFLESCGMDAFKGVQVTPIRARELLSNSDRCNNKKKLMNHFGDLDISRRTVKTVALAGEFYLAGYYQTSEYLYSLVESLFSLRLPYGTSTSPFLCRIAPTTEDAWIENTINGYEFMSRKGSYVYAIMKRGLKTQFSESGYGRLRRLLPMMGIDSILPEYGVADKPRSYRLSRRKFYRWYDTAYA